MGKTGRNLVTTLLLTHFMSLIAFLKFRYLLILTIYCKPNRVHAPDAVLPNVLKNASFILKIPHLKALSIKECFRVPFFQKSQHCNCLHKGSYFPKLDMIKDVRELRCGTVFLFAAFFLGRCVSTSSLLIPCVINSFFFEQSFKLDVRA